MKLLHTVRNGHPEFCSISVIGNAIGCAVEAWNNSSKRIRLSAEPF